jgi:hypothetical protein
MNDISGEYFFWLEHSSKQRSDVFFFPTRIPLTAVNKPYKGQIPEP